MLNGKFPRLCKGRRGDSALIESKSFHSTALKSDVAYSLYLPPGYATDTQRRFPVVFWLHGGGGGPGDCWKFVETIDAAIVAGRCPELIIVGVDGRSQGRGRTGSQYTQSNPFIDPDGWKTFLDRMSARGLGAFGKAGSK